MVERLTVDLDIDVARSVAAGVASSGLSGRKRESETYG